MHPSFVLSMPLRTIEGALDKQAISEAIDQHAEYYEKIGGK
jgi:hypothetical protein